MDPRFFPVELWPPGTRSVTYRMELELSQQEVHCVYDALTPDCLDKDPSYPQTIAALVVNSLFIFSRLMPCLF